MDIENEDACCGAGKAGRNDSALCPACRAKGKTVQPITIESLVVEEAVRRAGRVDGFRFCATAGCPVAYFHAETGARIALSEVRVRIGQKATESPRPVCYCFGHSVEEIEAEVLEKGTSGVADDIAEMCRQGLDRCKETNPQGSCCLGNVRKAVEQARAKAGSDSRAAAASAGAAGCCALGGDSAKANPVRRRRDVGLWAAAGSIGSAILSSACCWLPLLLIGFGASAAGVAGFFEAYRPHLLVVTGLLLAGGFYLIYFRAEKCGPTEACATPNPRLGRFNRIALWVATAVVLAFALFPNYVGYLLRNGEPRAAAGSSGESRAVLIDGMTCEACAATLRGILERVEGVFRADVSFESRTARIFFASGKAIPSDAVLLEAIRDAGYAGRLAQKD
ncbi:MAG: hypothetical protein Fur0037_09910 [Planctomycetota bacterium]